MEPAIEIWTKGQARRYCTLSLPSGQVHYMNPNLQGSSIIGTLNFYVLSCLKRNRLIFYIFIALFSWLLSSKGEKVSRPWDARRFLNIALQGLTEDQLKRLVPKNRLKQQKMNPIVQL
jgi:hypothetical protein